MDLPESIWRPPTPLPASRCSLARYNRHTVTVPPAEACACNKEKTAKEIEQEECTIYIIVMDPSSIEG